MIESPDYNWVTHKIKSILRKNIYTKVKEHCVKLALAVPLPKYWPQMIHFIVVQMKQWQSWFSKNIARNMDSADRFLLLWSFFWSYTLSASRRPEVPTVPQTVQVQGWPQLPHYGWTHNQGTQHANPKVAVRFSLLAVASKLIFDQPLPPRSSLEWEWELIFLHCNTDPLNVLVRARLFRSL